MKDIEKIQSPDLGCQIQDANPANFAIEQEVAQLVGATVPQPTQPGADDARELGAQLLVFLRRALTPIKSALRTTVAAIYAHLDSRCTAYTPAAYDPFRLPAGPYDPMRPFVHRTLPNLLTALTAFSDRKITGVPEAADGISLVNLMCSDARNGLTTFTDTNNGWDLTSVAAVNRIPQIFPNITKIVLGCFECHTNLDGLSTAVSIELEFPNLKRYTQPPISGHIEYMVAGTPAKMIFPELEEYSENPTTGRPAGLIYGMSNCTEVRAQKLSKVTIYSNGFGKITRCPKLQIVDFRSLRYFDLTGYSWGGYFPFQDCTNLIHLEFKEYKENVKYGDWNPTMALRTDTTADDYVDLREDTSLANNLEQFLANFSTYIIDRLEQRTASTTLTLTLNQAVRDVLTTEQEQAIAAKYWNLSPANKTT